MTPPPTMPCSFPECEFATPASIPTYELVLKALELHVNTAHGPVSNAKPIVKVEKPKRPNISCNMSESDWTFFEHKWNRYQRQSGISGQQVTDEIWACLDADIERLAFQDGLSSSDPTTLLEHVRNLAVTTVYPALHVVSLHEKKQSADESIKQFSARVRGIAKNGKLSKQCTKTGCQEQVSFIEETCCYVVMTGIHSEDLKEKVLTQAMIGNVKDLASLIEYAVAEESAKQKTPPRSLAAISRKSQPKTHVKKCIGCGMDCHGPLNRNRSAECQAFGKKCNKCGKMNHFSSVCKASSVKAVQAEPVDTEADASISGFITGVLSCSLITSPQSAKPVNSALKTRSKS